MLAMHRLHIAALAAPSSAGFAAATGAGDGALAAGAGALAAVVGLAAAAGAGLAAGLTVATAAGEGLAAGLAADLVDVAAGFVAGADAAA